MEPRDFVDYSEKFKHIAEEAELEVLMGEGDPKDYVVIGTNEVYGVRNGGTLSLTASKAHILLISGNIIPAEDAIVPAPEPEEVPEESAVVAPRDSDEPDDESDAIESE